MTTKDKLLIGSVVINVLLLSVIIGAVWYHYQVTTTTRRHKQATERSDENE